MWSTGVIMYMLLSGSPPFRGNTAKAMLLSVCKGKYSFSAECWNNVGDECKDVIRGLIEKNVEKRWTPSQALESRWITHQAPDRDDVHVHESLIGNMRAFHQEHRMKQLALHVMATQLDQSDIKELRAIFIGLDKDRDGHLSLEEFSQGLLESKLSVPDDLQQLMENVDIENTGLLDFADFIASTIDRRVQVQEQVCWAAFCAFDVNKDGRITRAEFAQMLQKEDIHLVKDASSPIRSSLEEMGFYEDAIDFPTFMMMIRGP